jgi:hypothetical protein
MDASLGISAIAVLVSVLSAYYARRSSNEAKRANRIASHANKLAVFESARSFQTVFRIEGDETASEIFYALFGATRNADLYFTKPVADRLQHYVVLAHKVFVVRDGMRRYESLGKEIPAEKSREVFGLVDECRKAGESLVDDLQAETRVVD